MDVVVIGAGQAGLSTSYHLSRRGVGHVVLDGSDGPGGAWQHRWPSLLLSTTHRVHDLPGLPFEPSGPSERAAVAVPAYFRAYEDRFSLPVRRPVRIRSVTRDGDRLVLRADEGEWTARVVVNATGTWSRPFWPSYPGQDVFTGRQLHTADYRGPEEFAGRSVVVVGGGASAVQLLSEISTVARTTWVTRREPVWVEGEFTEDRGRTAVALVEQAVAEGRPLASVVSVTGLGGAPYADDARARGVLERLPMFDRLVPDGVAWDDGRSVAADAVVWATGFRPAIEHLAPLRLREPGGGIRLVGTQAAKEPRLHLVGYGPSASTIGANRAGRAAARVIARQLRHEAAPAA